MIVELLIVIVVIAILASISIVAFSDLQNRAHNTTVESDISAIIKKLQLARAALGHNPYSVFEFPDGFGFSKSAYSQTANNIYYCIDRDADLYALSLRSISKRGYRIPNGAVSTDVAVTAAVNCEAIGKSVAPYGLLDIRNPRLHRSLVKLEPVLELEGKLGSSTYISHDSECLPNRVMIGEKSKTLLSDDCWTITFSLTARAHGSSSPYAR
jgi:type II secretory pathway pseudopilin PulG